MTILREFEVDGQKFAVRKPTAKELNEAEKIYRIEFKKALDDGLMPNLRFQDYIKEIGVWDDQKEMEYKTLQTEVRNLELELKKGGKKKSVGRDMAIQIKRKRMDMVRMLGNLANLSATLTAEGVANDMRFNFLVSKTVVYNEEGYRLYFSSLEDYLDRGDETVALEGAKLLQDVYFSVSDLVKELPENQFLRRFNYVNEDLDLINEDGKVIDEDGNIIDETEEKTEESPWLDEEGNPITE